MEFASDSNIRQIGNLVDEFRDHVLYDEPPVFVSDDATILDVWMGELSEIKARIQSHYGTEVADSEFTLPLWRLLKTLDTRRASQSP